MTHSSLFVDQHCTAVVALKMLSEVESRVRVLTPGTASYNINEPVGVFRMARHISFVKTAQLSTSSQNHSQANSKRKFHG